MSKYDEWRKRAARQGHPATAHLELTYRCNARCRHCFQDRTVAPDELSLDEWLRVVDELRDAGVLVINVSGGEARLSPRFWPVLERIRARGMAFRVFTNGILLDRDTCRRLARLEPASVDISIFSLDAGTHDGVTLVPGSLRKAVRGLVRLRHLGVHVRVKCPLLEEASRDFRAVRRLAERFGCGVVFDPRITPRFDGDLRPTSCRGDDDALVEYFEETTTPDKPPKLTPREPSADICGIARSFTLIAPDGRVLPCTHVQQSAGNVRDAGWVDIWHGSKLLQQLRASTFADLSTCNSCPRSGYCGRCGAVAMLEDGDFYGPSSRACRIAELKEQAWGMSRPDGAPPPPRRRARLPILP